MSDSSGTNVDLEKGSNYSAPSSSNDYAAPLKSTTEGYSTGRYDSRLTQVKPYEHDPRELERQLTAKSIQSMTVGRPAITTKSNMSHIGELPPFGGGKEYPPNLPNHENYIVDFDGPDDPIHPFNWPMRRKVITGVNLGFLTLVSAWGSAIFSAATQQITVAFNVSQEVAILGLTLYVMGFATGPLMWAPYSELYGRKQPLIISGFGSGIFQIGVAVAKDIQTVMICRFFAGVFAAAPLAVVGAAFADMFNNQTRGIALAVFAGAVFAGPMLAPIAGGFIVLNPNMGWRWTEYITAIMAFIATGTVAMFYSETYAPSILVNKAKNLRRLTGNWGIHARQEEISVSLKDLVVKNFSRPLKMLFDEPIIFLITIYTAFIYGILYLNLTAYPIIFQQDRGYNSGVGALPFLAIIIGEVCGSICVILFEPWYNRRVAANGGKPDPEARLPPLIIGSIVFPAGLFWLAWSGNADVHWIVPTLAGIFIGFGLITIFLQAINYLVDAYLMFAASALAANTFLRSMFGAVFPLFATQMFNRLGVAWAGSLLAFLGVAMIPVPILFYVYGKRIRKMSKRAPTQL